MKRYAIGIDPDMQLSGFAVWDRTLKQYELLTKVRFFDVFKWFNAYGKGNVHVRLEAGWLNPVSNYHPDQGSRRREKIAKNVGENHATGKLMEQWLQDHGFSYELVLPLGKRKAPEFKKLTGLERGYDQEVRDAAMLVLQF